MKKTIPSFLVGIMLITLSATSCKKDSKSDPNPTPNPTTDTVNYFRYMGKKYEVAKVIILFDDIWASAGIYTYSVHMVTKSVTWDGFLTHLDGTGDGLVYDFVSNSSTNFMKDLYAIDTADNIVEPGEISNAFIAKSYDFFMSDGTIIPIKSGNCKLKLNSDQYEFTAAFKTPDNKLIDAYYKGTITQYHR